MLDERLAHFERQIQPRELRVALLQFIDAAQAKEVVIESAEWLEALVEGGLHPAWPKGGWPMSWARAMASVRSSLSRKPPRHGAGHLGDFERMRQPGAVVVVDRRDEHLRLAGHAAEGGAVDDPFAIALVERAEGMVGLRDAAGRGTGPRGHGVGASQPSSNACQSAAEMVDGTCVVPDGNSIGGQRSGQRNCSFLMFPFTDTVH